MTLRKTHCVVLKEWEFVEGNPVTASCGAVVGKAVAIDSEDGEIPECSCKECQPFRDQAVAQKSYFVVVCRGDEQRMGER